MVRSAIVVAILLSALSAAASPATDLGEAHRAYDANELAKAAELLAKLDDKQLVARDYAIYLRGMIALRTGDAKTATARFTELAKVGSPRYGAQIPWRLADAQWLVDRPAAARAYGKLVATKTAGTVGDVGTARFRIAQTKSGKAAEAAYRAMAIAHPSHPLATRAEAELATPWSPEERIERAKQLTEAHQWDEAVVELSLVEAPPDTELRRQHDYWLGVTLFKMRRRYAESGDLLLGVYAKLGGEAASAMFHGARALSRADRDDEAIVWYGKVVATYPNTIYAQEAQYLAGWLEFNRGKYREAVKPLERMLDKYPKSKFADEALWFLGMSHYFLNDWSKARQRLAQLAKYRGSLEGGKGQYWLARIDERLKEKDAAIAGYLATVEDHPFSWYALLARSRLAALAIPTSPFGKPGAEKAAARGPKLAATVDEALASDELIRRADELIAAGLGVEAGDELARGEYGFLKRHDRARAFAMLLDRYRKAGNFNRPWLLAVSNSGSALDGPPTDDARRWWENAYPRAYQELIEKYEGLGSNPSGYLYSIMRKESGFNPHDLSYADAQGLLQMIPPTTQRVARELGIPYDEGRLYEPAYNIQTASWYIGHLLAKFKSQIPLASGSFNSGPRPVMKWMEQNGDREMDELVELVPYTQTREYMKKVTENFARYRYLYDAVEYEQPLAVDKHYVKDQLTY